ncbi:unnamed protein product [Clavelina lepadiformis]|uniref:Uncharacterized protein n=1 Tax=Clavelina lepadiformis TaxID=159417 RepID=A0ABP0GNP2_CLALP
MLHTGQKRSLRFRQKSPCLGITSRRAITRRVPCMHVFCETLTSDQHNFGKQNGFIAQNLKLTRTSSKPFEVAIKLCEFDWLCHCYCLLCYTSNAALKTDFKRILNKP